MANKNLELAKKIVEQHATLTKHSEYDIYIVDLTSTIGHKATYGNKKEVELNDGPEPTTTMVFTKTTKAEAKEMAAKDIAKQLDDGVIVLSDTWADDNLS